MSLVIDVHTHMMGERWFELLKEHGGPRYATKDVGALKDVIHMDGAPFMTPNKEMFDYELRVKNMTKSKVDLAIVSLTCPNVYWGDCETSLQAARLMNDDMAGAQRAFPDRIRHFAFEMAVHFAFKVLFKLRNTLPGDARENIQQV